MERVGLDHPPNSDATVVYGYCKEKIMECIVDKMW
jgi:hypothetical protein